NTQSGTQWDGLRHFPLIEHGIFYNNMRLDALPHGTVSFQNPHQIDPAHARIGIQNWATHGICGRGMLLDLVSHQTSLATNQALPYDPWSAYAISVPELEACAQVQGIKFQWGDILILCVRFTKKYYEALQAEREALQGKPETFAGIKQSEDMKHFIWDNWHFAATAFDQPALEAQTLLGFVPFQTWGILEKLSEVCTETGRYTFFFSFLPLNIIGRCASPPNEA
ncbi:hypothetical protein DFH07DRAFT_1031039, partial [Mycena maculata]